MSPSEIGEVLKFPKIGKVLHKLIHQFPRLELKAFVSPITQSYIRIEIEITPDFLWDNKIHGRQQLFHVIVEDVDGEMILHHEMYTLHGTDIDKVQTLSFFV
jgi:pre-mRNA-splicing helicase BRR2